jgi:hypothetical protein
VHGKHISFEQEARSRMIAPMLQDLPTLIAALPDPVRAAADRMFLVDVAIGHVRPPASMEPWIIGQFGSVAAVRTQTIVHVLNQFTLEGALFNPLRSRRPAGSHGTDQDLERWLAEEFASDMFTRPLHDTPADTFGRITGDYCITASNIAKYEAWHGLVIPHEPHPLHFDALHIRDYLDVALRWIAAAHTNDPQARFPLITWNCLPKSGATMAHGHWQIALGRRQPYARIENWRRAGLIYQTETGRSYLDDLISIHTTLELGLGLADLAAFAHLTPVRNRELVLIDTHFDASQQACIRMADAIAILLRGLIERLGVRAFNLALALPPLGAQLAGWDPGLAIVRIGDRGPALTTRNDLGAMELYGTGVISEDPFAVATTLRP